jgi:hypothetical protein
VELAEQFAQTESSLCRWAGQLQHRHRRRKLSEGVGD